MRERSRTSGFPISGGSATSTKGPAGRVCEEAGCTTVLSIYNEFEFCSLHQPMVVPRMRGKILED